jgi:hypothetical protein
LGSLPITGWRLPLAPTGHSTLLACGTLFVLQTSPISLSTTNQQKL